MQRGRERECVSIHLLTLPPIPFSRTLSDDNKTPFASYPLTRSHCTVNDHIVYLENLLHRTAIETVMDSTLSKGSNIWQRWEKLRLLDAVALGELQLLYNMFGSNDLQSLDPGRNHHNFHHDEMKRMKVEFCKIIVTTNLDESKRVRHPNLFHR